MTKIKSLFFLGYLRPHQAVSYDRLILLWFKDSLFQFGQFLFQLFLHGCADNEFFKEDASLIGKGKTLEEAIKIAEEFQEENIVEYGIHFFGR